MKGILEDIKTGQLKQAYLLYGEEAYLRKQYRDKLREALGGDSDSMNSHYFEGKDINCGEIIDLAETLPFLAERRVITIENSGLFKKGGEALAEYLAAPSESTYFVFVETEIDKRSKLYKAVQKLGRVEEFGLQDEGTLKRWILGMVKKEEKKISESTLNLFLDKTGTDMENIRGELEKVFCYTLEKDVITEADIEAVCTHRVSNQIFDMINAIADKKQKRALELYYDLLTLKEPPMRILFLIARQFNLLMQVKELKGKGYDNKSIAEKTGLHSFVAGKYVAQCGRFKMSELKQAVTACVEAETAVKTGKMTDILSVELLIVQYSA
ncbi:MAG: DNA polymerase III subunit delta [Clostridiales bacterium]|nr:DNA polymerase III subunit delta [Clostridiales bacterium]